MTLYRKVSNAQDKVSNGFERYMNILNLANVSNIYVSNIQIIYEKLNKKEPFGQKDIQIQLKCSKSKSTNIIKVMKSTGIIQKVKGYGSGKYVFIK